MPKTHADYIKEAVENLGESTAAQIIEWIKAKYPNITVNENSYRSDIIGCSINHTSNHHYPGIPKFLHFDKNAKTYNMAVSDNLSNSDSEIEIPEDEDSIDIPVDKRKVYTDKGDPEIQSLYTKTKKGKLNLQPDFQRNFVWDKVKSSRLIESALLDIPMPIIYLSEEKDNKEYVIDGQQRLTSFFSFIDGKYPGQSDFKLAGLKVYSELNGKSYKDLSEPYQDKIQSYTVRTITFKQESDSDLKFEIFERLNTGSVSLNDQELRNCIYRGPYNELLKNLSQDHDFMYLLGYKEPDNRMKDAELVLRFAAFYHATYLHYKPPMRQFLNADMEKYRNISPADSKDLKNAFKNSVSIIRSLLDKNAFKRFYSGDAKNPNGAWEQKKFNASLYDILMYTFASEAKNMVYQNLDAIREALICLLSDNQDFIDSIELSTSSFQSVQKRFDIWRRTLQEILGFGQKEPRCFTNQLKIELFAANHTCAICGNEIKTIDDAAVDHIKQYWTGGKTIPENARLTHRYCNLSRPRKE